MVRKYQLIVIAMLVMVTMSMNQPCESREAQDRTTWLLLSSSINELMSYSTTLATGVYVCRVKEKLILNISIIIIIESQIFRKNDRGCTDHVFKRRPLNVDTAKGLWWSISCFHISLSTGRLRRTELTVDRAGDCSVCSDDMSTVSHSATVCQPVMKSFTSVALVNVVYFVAPIQSCLPLWCLQLSAK